MNSPNAIPQEERELVRRAFEDPSSCAELSPSRFTDPSLRAIFAEIQRRHLAGETVSVDAVSRTLLRKVEGVRSLLVEITGAPTISAADEAALAAELTRPDKWPAPMHAAAFHGLAGDFVRLVEPHTEASREALLVQFLVTAGSLIGRGPHCVADGAEHHGNLFAVVAGPTSTGRKGTSAAHALAPARAVDAGWTTASGLVSGEGLVHHVRDASDTGDAGVADKRLCVVEGEFARVLQAAARQGNTLSPTLRLAFDGAVLSTLAKNSPEKATGAHVSVIGHITPEELRRHLDRTEIANGLGNRFLWIAARRSKLLPEGGTVSAAELGEIERRLGRMVALARTRGRLERDEAARALWRSVYGELTKDRPGLLGELTARAAALAVRLSLLFALLDGANEIRREHLSAALAVLDFVERSVCYVFGDALGDPDADSILRALDSASDGLTRQEISAVFGRNKPASVIERALAVLAQHGRASVEMDPPGDGGGRPAERWRSTKYEGTQSRPGLLRFLRSMGSTPDAEKDGGEGRLLRTSYSPGGGQSLREHVPAGADEVEI